MSYIRRVAAIAASTALLLAACSGELEGGSDDDTSDDTTEPENGDDADMAPEETLRIGYVSPQTGPLAPFGEADTFVVDQVQQHFAENPLDIGGTLYDVEVLVRDTQSDPVRAGEVASELINSDGVDLILVASTPETTNPVADQCEANAVPCISSVAPWQPFFFGRGGTPDSSFAWTYHFFWGLEDVEAVYMDMWDAVETNQQAGALWPNDADGNAWGDPVNGFAPVVAERGYSIIDPGFYPNGTEEFSAQISEFNSGGADILLGVPIPPDFTNFWVQAKQQGYNPVIATIGKALLFPSSVEALGDIGHNLGTEVWWSPSHPFASSLTGQSAEELAAAYEETTGSQWTQPIGFVHALFEVAAAALTGAGTTDGQAVVDVLAGLSMDTVVGSLDWTSGPVPNVAKTPLVGGQWRLVDGGEDEFELIIVSNEQAADIPTGGSVEPLP